MDMDSRQFLKGVADVSEYRTARHQTLAPASKDDQDGNQPKLNEFVENAYLCEMVEVSREVVDKLCRSERDSQFDDSLTPDIGGDGYDTDSEPNTCNEQCDRWFLDPQPQMNRAGSSS